jgi:hypothetical protein
METGATPALHTFLEAAAAVRRDAPHPLTVREITDQALLRRLLTPKGNTPDSSMSAVLYYAEKRPETCIVRLHEPGESRARQGSMRWKLKDKRE